MENRMNKAARIFFYSLFLSAAIGGCGGDGGGVNGPESGAIRVTTSTTGQDLDPDGYTCRMDGGARSQPIGVNDTYTFSNIATGQHSIELTGVANNCEVSGENPRSVSILIAGQNANSTFNVICERMTGSLAVTVVTDGDTLDPDGYTVTVDGTDAKAIGIVDAATFPDLPQGNHSVELSGIAKNCALTGPNPRSVSITVSQTTQEIFQVTCVPALFDRIVFNSDRMGSQDVFVMLPDGSSATQITGHEFDEERARVSPDGSRIVFIATWDGNDEVYVVNADGSGAANLTNSAAADQRAAWSPDGSKIAFYSDRDGDEEVYVMNSDGSALTQLTQNDFDDGGPAWSPDGSEIAFGSDRDGWNQIYVMRSADGGNVRRLTNSQDLDGIPAWSPDGTKIAFHRNSGGNFDVYVINADGSNERRLTDDPAFDGIPDWSPDGTKIVFASGRDGDFEVYVMNADGTNLTRITFDEAHDSNPRWTPTR
jgi:Tol biopolymer transport system component